MCSIVRHFAAGAVELLAQKVSCSVINAGDGSHQHPTQALLDALTIKRAKGPPGSADSGHLRRYSAFEGGALQYPAIERSECAGARSSPLPPLLPPFPERLGAEVFTSMTEGLKDADVVMMLRLQRERMNGSYVPSEREYFRFFGLDAEKLSVAKPDAIIMHPGPMNRGWKSIARLPMIHAVSFRNRCKWALPCVWPFWRALSTAYA